MITFERDINTGLVVAYRDGEKVGVVNAFGDDPLTDSDSDEKDSDEDTSLASS